MQSLDDFAQAELDALDRQDLRRTLHTVTRRGGAIAYDGKPMVSFSCNDYLNLSTHPRIIAASVAATRQHGTGAGASRLVTGNHPLYAELESRLAALKQTQACCVFGSGYLANTGIIPALVGRSDLVLVDALAHSCIWAGATLSGARLRRFRHNDMDHLATLLETERGKARRILILTDRVFSMDGDLAPLAQLVPLAARHDAWLMSDDAHGLGVLPREDAAVPLQMGTLSKAIGGYGGYICASEPVVALLRNRARTLVYSTGLPPGVLAAAIAALDLLAEQPSYAARPLRNARLFAAAAGLPTPQSPIVPVILGEVSRALSASAYLAEHGFLVAAIRPPTVPQGTARLRLTFTVQQTDADILRLAALVRPLL